jgi:phosphoglycerate-specific signal transduction histidine kinase
LEHEIAVLKVDIKKCMDVDTRYNYLQNQIDDINLLLSELIENETKNYINFDNNDKNIINSTMNNEIDDETETENEIDLVIENVENIGESVADEISKILH